MRVVLEGHFLRELHPTRRLDEVVRFFQAMQQVLLRCEIDGAHASEVFSGILKATILPMSPECVINGERRVTERTRFAMGFPK
jgi:hypothetical protein